MGAGGVVLLILGVVAAVALLLALVGVPLLRRLRRRIADLSTSMTNEAAAAGERIVLGPESGVYRGGDPPFPRVKGNAVVMLTDRRLECRMAVGRSITVPTTEIADARTVRWFRGAARGGQTHVVVSTSSGAQLGFYVRDADRWSSELVPTPPG